MLVGGGFNAFGTFRAVGDWGFAGGCCAEIMRDDRRLEAFTLEPAETESIDERLAPLLCLVCFEFEPTLARLLISLLLSFCLGGRIEAGLMTCDAPFLYDRWMLSLFGLAGLTCGAWFVMLEGSWISEIELGKIGLAEGGDCWMPFAAVSLTKNCEPLMPMPESGGDGKLGC